MGIKEYIKSKKAQKELGEVKYRKVLDIIKDGAIDRSRVYPTEYFAATQLIDDLRDAKLRVSVSDFFKFVGAVSTVGGACVIGQTSGDLQQILAGIACFGMGAVLGVKGTVNGIKAKQNYSKCRDLLKKYLRLRTDDNIKIVVDEQDLNGDSEYSGVTAQDYSIGGILMSGATQDTCLTDACDELAEGR